MDQRQNDQSDIIDLFQTIWAGKAVIALISSLSVLSVVTVFSLRPQPDFVAKTEIKPILAHQADVYRTFNDTGVFAIYASEKSRAHSGDIDIFAALDKDRNKDSRGEINNEIFYSETPYAGLFERYLDIFTRRQALREAIKKFGFIAYENFDKEEDYEIAVARLAATVKILPPVNQNGTTRGEARIHWTIRFTHNDQEKWLRALDYTDNLVNEQVRISIRKQFENLLNAEKQSRQNDIEDLRQVRANLTQTHKQELESRIAFLQEQAELARELEIADYAAGDPILVARTFDYMRHSITGGREISSEVQSDKPFYLRGYKAIEKELELITKRKNDEPFIDGLLQIDEKIRQLGLEQKILRAEKTFAETPIVLKTKFTASSVSVTSTQFESKSNLSLFTALAFVFGTIAGVAYVVFRKELQDRKPSLNKT